MGRGVVCFVSVGPGDPGLRAERAAERLAGADVVVLEGEATAEGLVALARQEKRVACVVQGDALEEHSVAVLARALAGAGVRIEVVPGIGARGAAAAFAGVLGRAVRVDAAQVADAVAGEARDGPVTLVAGAGGAGQRVIVTTAATAPARARELGDGAVVVAFGRPDVALGWFERQALFGKRVLVTRAREQAGSTAALLRDRGADALVLPTIEIRPPADPAPLAQALADLRRGAYGWVAFTSANGVDRTWEALVASGGDARAFGAARIAAIGPATARALDGRGLRADVVAKEFRGERLATEMLAAIRAGGPPPRVLLARAARARDVLPDALRAAGCPVDVVAAYETHPPPPATVAALARDLDLGRVDAVLFTSSSTVDNLCDLLGARAVDLLGRARVASIGPVTTGSARARGLRVDVTAREYTVSGLVEALAESYG